MTKLLNFFAKLQLDRQTNEKNCKHRKNVEKVMAEIFLLNLELMNDLFMNYQLREQDVL